MWECKICNFKNSNSSLNCHGAGCRGKRDEVAINIPKAVLNTKESMVDTREDYCPVCKKRSFFSKDKRKRFRLRYRCHGCHKMFRFHKDKEIKPDLITPPEIEIQS